MNCNSLKLKPISKEKAFAYNFITKETGIYCKKRVAFATPSYPLNIRLKEIVDFKVDLLCETEPRNFSDS
jgi:hypothetical protein